MYLSPLTSLTRIRFCKGTETTAEDIASLGQLVNFRDLDALLQLRGSGGVWHWASLTSLTKLRLKISFAMTDECANYLRWLLTLRELAFHDCFKIADVGVQHLASLTSLTTLILDKCYGMKDEVADCLGILVGLRELDLWDCSGMRGARLQHWGSQHLWRGFVCLTALSLQTKASCGWASWWHWGFSTCIGAIKWQMLGFNIGTIDVCQKTWIVSLLWNHRKKHKLFGEFGLLKPPRFARLLSINRCWHWEFGFIDVPYTCQAGLLWEYIRCCYEALKISISAGNFHNPSLFHWKTCVFLQIWALKRDTESIDHTGRTTKLWQQINVTDALWLQRSVS